jgi:hydrogen cyanide synthase HcnA
MSQIHRISDITPIEDETFLIKIDGSNVDAALGETVLSVMMAAGKRQIMVNDHQISCGAYCGMGICHSCHVKINGRYKQRACQTIVEPNMDINTNANKFQDIGVNR